jgi:hypothetical protein
MVGKTCRKHAAEGLFTVVSDSEAEDDGWRKEKGLCASARGGPCDQLKQAETGLPHSCLQKLQPRSDGCAAKLKLNEDSGRLQGCSIGAHHWHWQPGHGYRLKRATSMRGYVISETLVFKYIEHGNSFANRRDNHDIGFFTT